MGGTDENEKPILTNWEKNKAKILYYFGVFVVAVIRYMSSGIVSLLPEGAWYTQMIIGIVESSVWFVAVIAPYIFGKDTDLDRVKDERKTLGIENGRLLNENTGLRITNKLQADILEENDITAIRYTEDGKYTTVAPSAAADAPPLPDPTG